jgi:hypothetical protein
VSGGIGVGVGRPAAADGEGRLLGELDGVGEGDGDPGAAVHAARTMATIAIETVRDGRMRWVPQALDR